MINPFKYAAAKARENESHTTIHKDEQRRITNMKLKYLISKYLYLHTILIIFFPFHSFIYGLYCIQEQTKQETKETQKRK